MNKISRFFSYVITALLASILTLAAVTRFAPPVSKLNQLEQLIMHCFIGEADKAAMEDAAAAAMVDALGDRWSAYIPVEYLVQYQAQNDNAYVGIGVTIEADEETGGFLILHVQAGSPANEAGIQSGDIILSADGKSTADMTVNDLTTIVRGEVGTTVHIGIQRSGEMLEFDILRANVLTDVVTQEMLDDRIGLIKIANFNTRCASEAISAIESLREQGAQALIFDVRNNPGGYVDELVQLLDYLLPEGDLFRSLDYTGKEIVETSDANYLDMPIAVICNKSSYSAAEFFPAAIQEYGAGVIVGAATYGKGYFQCDYMLKDGSVVKLSVGKYFTPNGNSLIGTGIQPDLPVSVTAEQEYLISIDSLPADEDPQIQAAMDALRGK